MKLRFVATCSLAAIAAAGFAQSTAPNLVQQTAARIRLPIPTGPMNGTYDGYVMVKYPQDVASQIATQAAGLGSKGLSAPWGTFLRRIAKSGWTIWKVPTALTYETIAARVKTDSRVVTVEHLNRIYPLADPNDLDYNAMETGEEFILNFGESDLSFRRLWHILDDNAPDAWADWPNKWYTAANKPTNVPTIAFIDTGCDMNHPDFINAGGAGSDTTQGGQLLKSKSVFFEFGDVAGNDTEDYVGHGTHVTGIALASANNGGYAGHGVIGTGYNSRGMILRVFDNSGNGSDADAAAAIYYAADNGADVINLSLGTTNFSQLFQDAVTYAWQKGTLIICAGNESGSGGGDLGPIYPAACSGALAVSANGPNGVPATTNYSGTGRYVDIAAPGGDVKQGSDNIVIQYVFSTSMRNDGLFSQMSADGSIYPPYTNDYSYLVGTSMACPNVSGAAGLFYGKFNLRQGDGWSNLRAYRALERSAASVMGAPHGTWEPYQGYGCLDMWSLLQEADAREAVSGSIEGMVYSSGTPTSNVSVKAQKLDASGVPSGVTFSTTTAADGTYRFDDLPAGTFKIWSSPFGQLKEKYAKLVPGCDFTGCDFWCGTFTGDSTAPVVPKFSVQTVGANYIDVKHWAYDTETGIDSIVFRIGTSQGGSEVMADKIIVIDTNLVRLSNLTLPAGTYYLQGVYTNGNGTPVTKVATFSVGNATTITGTVTLQDFIGTASSIPVTIQLRTPGTTTVVSTSTVNLGSGGSFSVTAPGAGPYDVAVKGPRWLRSVKTNVAVGASAGAFSLLNGDVNGDNQVTSTDQALLSAAFRSNSSSSNWNANADLNGDGQVTSTDQAVLSKNFRKTGAN